MNVPQLHRWPQNASAAIALQKKLADQVRHIPLPETPRFIGGCDAAFTRDGASIIAAALVWDRKSKTIVESHAVTAKVSFPYIPGLLSFREVPALVKAFRLLKTEPDVVLCDGQGIAHPRRFGLAAHLGLWLQVPTVGCAKSRLCGTHRAPAEKRGSRARLIDRGEIIGTVLRTRDRVRPLFVSIGHLCTLSDAVRITLACNAGYRLPEPTRLADQLVARVKRESG